MVLIALLITEVLSPPAFVAAEVPAARLAEVAATTIDAPFSTIYSVAISPDGKSVACACHKGTVVLSFPDGKVLHKFAQERDERVGHVMFTPDGKRLLGVNPGLQVWDLATGKRLVGVTWDWERTRSTTISPEGKTAGNTEPIPRSAISPDGKWLYVGGSIDDFRVLDTATGKELKRVRFLGKSPVSFAPSPDGKTFVVTTADALIFFNTDKFIEVKRVDLPESRRRSRYCVRFPEGNERLFVLGPSGEVDRAEIRVWECEKREFTLRLPTVWPNDTFEPRDAAVTLVGNGRYALVSCSGTSGIFGIYDLKEAKTLGWTGTKKGHPGPLVPTPDGKHLIGGCMSDNLVVIKVEDVLKLVETPAKKP